MDEEQSVPAARIRMSVDPGVAPVAAQDADRWVLAWDGDSRLIVITNDGRVFAHALVPVGSEIPR